MDSIILDERMTEETKNFVRDALKTKKVGEFIHVEPAITRRKQLDAALKANESIKLENIKITEFTVKNKFDNFEIPVTCYMPEKVHDNYSINLFFHGGGWTFGSVDTYKYSVYLLAESTKSCWLSVEYRLAPENRFPTQINDCISVFEWVFENKLKFGTEKSKIGICGNSAGGHLAALLANDYCHMIDYQILIYPCLDFSKVYDSQLEFKENCYILVPHVRAFYRNNLLNGDDSLLNSPKLSPILEKDLSKIPRTLLILAQLDPLRDQGIAYHKRLIESNVKCELRIVQGVIHGFFKHPVQMKNAFFELKHHIVEFLNE